MTFSEAVKTCLVDKYATFSGRATRSEYWYYCLFCILLWLFLIVLLTIVGNPELLTWISVIIGVLFIIPNWSVTFRRLHDIGRSGWCVLICLIPYLGRIILIIMMCLNSDEDNEYGPKPLN